MFKNSFVALVIIMAISACQNSTTKDVVIDTSLPATPGVMPGPNFNYTIAVPEGWTTRDTVMQEGMRIKLISAPASMKADDPLGNVLISGMDGKRVSDFMASNMNYLETNMPGVKILEHGAMEEALDKGRWYTYTKDQNGKVRDMINYIIPSKGYAYMFTFGVKHGSMPRYREIFDNIVRSFKG